MFTSKPHVVKWSRTADCLGDVTGRRIRGLIPKWSATLVSRVVRDVDSTYSDEQSSERYE